MTTERALCVPCSGTGLRDEHTLCPTCGGSGGKSQPADRDPDVVAEPVAEEVTEVVMPEPETASTVEEFPSVTA